MPGYELPSRQLVSQSDRSMVQSAEVPRARFVGTWTHKTTFDAGFIIPFLLEEIYPGDHMKYRVTAYVRMSTPLFPMFSNQRVDTHFFFVPNRLVWDNWPKFMGEQDSPGDSIAYTIPQKVSAAGGFGVNTIYDHYGLPVVLTAGQTISVSALPFRGYRLIWNQWFRDENMQNSVSVLTNDGPDATAFALLQRGKSHDYFTSCLPWPQKFTAPTVPVLGLAPVRGLGVDPASTTVPGPVNIEDTLSTRSWANYYGTGTTAFAIETVGVDGTPQVFADLSVATGVSINTLRQSFLVQQLLERDARGGTRYIEKIWSHFRVRSPDARMQRTEYIGGGQTPLHLTPIAQTAPTTGVPLGALGATGTAAGDHTADYAATEHGYIHGFISVRSELSYQQGLRRMWTRQVQTDFYFPSLAGLGEQAVLRQEIYCTGVDADDATVFGYQARFDELRQRTSEITGQFRSGVAGTLDMWHLAQSFSAAPVLGNTFIVDSPPMTRVLAAGALAANQQYLADIMITRDATRPLPSFGTPVLLGRF